MAFTATKREWSELYAFFRLLSNGYANKGTAGGKKTEDDTIPVALIKREEHNGTRNYYIEKSTVRIKGEEIDKEVAREEFGKAADAILASMKASAEDEVLSPQGVEEFLDEIGIYNLEAQTTDRTDLHIAFWHQDAPQVGMNIRSRIGKMNPLLDGGRAANLKFELTDTKLPNPTVNKVNALETPNEVADRMIMIERLGGVLKYNDVADRVFRANLQMIDLHFPRLLAEMLRIMHLDGITRVSELTEVMKQINPLKIKDELINKHGFYEYKMKQFLTAVALGMRPAKIFNGTDSAVEGFMLIDGSGEILCYHKSDRQTFEDFLFNNTRFDKGPTEKDKYGFLEKENGVYYFKLNVKIGLLKR